MLFPQTPNAFGGTAFGVDYLKQLALSHIALKINCEIFDIFKSHNKLSERHLHNLQLFAVDNCQLRRSPNTNGGNRKSVF
jgi:hypothetical protein